MGNTNTGVATSNTGLYGGSQGMANGMGNSQGMGNAQNPGGANALDTISQAYAGIQQYAGLSGLLNQGKYCTCGLALLSVLSNAWLVVYVLMFSSTVSESCGVALSIVTSCTCFNSHIYLCSSFVAGSHPPLCRSVP